MRARTFATKEPGTIDWLSSEVKPGQTFYDVGANMGLYSVLAAHLVGPAGRIVAIEPHLENCAGLLINLTENGYAERSRILSCALHDSEGFFDFEYSSFSAGEAFNQLVVGQRPSVAVPQKTNRKMCSELKYAVSIDRLVFEGNLPAPNHIKIDVDGNELPILMGMQAVLNSPTRPATIQVEADPSCVLALNEYLERFGYGPGERHDTANGMHAIQSGVPAETITHNLIFRSVSS